MKNSNLKRIAIFASGSGTNAENIVNFFNDNPDVEVNLILSNKKDAYVLQRAKRLNVKSVVFSREEFYKSSKILNTLHSMKIDLVVLAGFLWLIPENIISSFRNMIVNIHPALLPKYGGKGMYGNFVHEAVIKNKEKESGITIHYVNEIYDEGQIIFQEKVEVLENDSPDSLAQKIHILEYKYFPKVIEEILFEKC
ncbi:phosphoribosylglycinamide formyltransferase [Bacteroidota bacterium]